MNPISTYLYDNHHILKTLKLPYLLLSTNVTGHNSDVTYKRDVIYLFLPVFQIGSLLKSQILCYNPDSS